MGIDNKIGISRVVPCFSGMSRGLPIVYAELIMYFHFFLIAVSIFFLLWAHFMYSFSNVMWVANKIELSERY